MSRIVSTFFDRVNNGDFSHYERSADVQRNNLIQTASGMVIMSWLNQDDLKLLRSRKLVAAIKNFREHVNCGLVDAKWAVESEWIYLVKHGLEGPWLKDYHDSDSSEYLVHESDSRHGQIIMIEDRFYKLQEVSRSGE